MASLAAGISLAGSALVAAEAAEISVQPPNPQLGDTLVVTITTDPTTALPNSPLVYLDQQSFPTFPLEANRWRALIPTTPLDQPGMRQVQISGLEPAQLLKVNLQDRSFPTQSIRLAPGVPLEASEIEIQRIQEFKNLVTPEKYWQGAFLKPNQGAVSTIYGVRRYYNGVFAENYYHRGVDYAGGLGSSVVAPAAGRVALVGLVSEGFRVNGNTVGIDHGQGVLSVLLHLSRIDVQEGDIVQAGQVIGAIGATGISTGPHLHWGLYVHGSAVDPVPWRFAGIE